MQHEERKAIAEIGGIISLYFIIQIGSFWLTDVLNIPHPLHGSIIAAATIIASPFAFIVLIITSILSFKLHVSAWHKIVLAGINIIGVIITAAIFFYGCYSPAQGQFARDKR